MQMMCGTAVLFKKLLRVCQYHSNPCFNGYFVVIFHVLHTNKGSLSYFFVCVFCFSSLQSTCGFCFITCHIFPALLLWLFLCCCCFGLHVFIQLFFFVVLIFTKLNVVPYISLSSCSPSFSAFLSCLSSSGFFSHNLTQVLLMLTMSMLFSSSNHLFSYLGLHYCNGLIS